MDDCFLKGFGKCGDKITREHYISENVLRFLSNNNSTISISGLAWQKPSNLQEIGISSLHSKMLCSRHNESLSELDKTAGVFVKALDSVDKNPEKLPDTTIFEGEEIERWFLKVLCGLVRSSNIGNGVLPESWLNILHGETFPAHWGLYFSLPKSVQNFKKEFELVTLVNPKTKEILAVNYRVVGIPLTLVLGEPDKPSSFGIYHPTRLIFNRDGSQKVLELRWDHNSHRSVYYQRQI